MFSKKRISLNALIVVCFVAVLACFTGLTLSHKPQTALAANGAYFYYGLTDGVLTISDTEVDGTTEKGQIELTKRLNNSQYSHWLENKTQITTVKVVGNVAPKYTDFWFFGCENITEMDLTNLDTSGVTSMEQMFYGCNGLNGTFGKNGTAIKVGDKFTTASVTNMRYMFSGCSGLTYIDVSFFDTAKVTTTYAMFQYFEAGGTFGKNGTAIKIGDKFSTSSVTDMEFMFSDCSGLTSIDISSFDTSKLKSAHAMFLGCRGLSGTFGKKGTAIKIGDKFKTTSVTDMSSMFWSCSGLTAIDLTSFDTALVTDMSYMFKGCSGLTAIDLTSFNTSIVTDMSYMFSECSGLEEVNLSSFNTAEVVRISSFLSECTSLASVDLSDFDLSSATSVGNFFNNCNALATIKTPKTLSSPRLWLPTKYRNAKGESGKDINYLTCTRCDYTTYKEITALGHDKVHHEKKDPTCTEIGWNAYDTCTRCEYATYEEKSALGHSEVKDNAKMPTCAESGLTEGKHCSVCNTVLERQQTVPALGHDFETDFSVDKEPTVTEKGSKSKHCSRCGEKAEVTEIPMLEKKLVNPGGNRRRKRRRG